MMHRKQNFNVNKTPYGHYVTDCRLGEVEYLGDEGARKPTEQQNQSSRREAMKNCFSVISGCEVSVEQELKAQRAYSA